MAVHLGVAVFCSVEGSPVAVHLGVAVFCRVLKEVLWVFTWEWQSSAVLQGEVL